MSLPPVYDDFYQVSWKRFIFPGIHPKGKIIVFAVFLILILIFGCFYPLWTLSIPFWITLGLILFPLFVFAWYFFRNPERFSPEDPQVIIAPADGIVSAIRTMIPPPTLEIGSKPLIRVSIFMSVFNVHINRCPVGGEIRALTYHKGKFVNVSHKDSDDNERQEICIERSDGIRIGVVQIAGLVARRIYCPLKVGENVQAGNVFGLIRFGSRLDVYLPEGTLPLVRPGQTMVAGESILARLNSSPLISQNEPDPGVNYHES
ncbi:MAG: phosphatidylserine decarboxylase [Planctomycetia bacterium]|nr:phosphatidylserine decarboxylase [Planctomycetia bacterium]